MKRAVGVVLQVSLLVGLATVAIGTIPASAVTLSSCTGTTSLPANDDGFAGPVNTGFTLSFFGANFTQLFVNNNGNVTFGAGLTAFTPGPIQGGGTPIIAPFWADVDTRGGGALTTYGSTMFGGHNAFCVNWDGVGYFAAHTFPLNNFQLLLVDRSDITAGDFDIVFNYQHIGWETGDANMGSGRPRR